MTKKRARRVGFGMQPRQPVGDVDVNETTHPVDGEKVSAQEVQQEAQVEAVPEVVEGERKGSPLDLSSLQNLDSEPQEEAPTAEIEPIVAQNEVLEASE